MWAEVSRLNLIELVPALQIPVFFLLGRRDPWIPPETGVAYFDALTAPVKKLVWFEHSGHEPFVDEPGKFNATMADVVRPVLLPDAVRRNRDGRRARHRPCRAKKEALWRAGQAATGLTQLSALELAGARCTAGWPEERWSL